MGIQRNPFQREETREAVPFTIVKKMAEPVMVASQKYHRTNPAETLQLAVTVTFLLTTFIGELLTSLPWLWYVVFALWITFTYKLPFPIKRKKHDNRTRPRPTNKTGHKA